jgi:transposase
MANITMSIKETRRIPILDKLKEKLITQVEAARLMEISTKQTGRLLAKYKQDGAASLVHKLRGVPSNHQANEKVLDQALVTIKAKYHDFSVTLAHEKLVEHHGFTYSRETLRSVMLEAGMWKVKRKTKVIVHELRERRKQEGELIQIDGSPHDWFEGRAPYCNLLVFIDDATGKLKYLQFVAHETTEGYFAGIKQYINENGKPKSLYSDRHGIFRINTSKKGTASVSDETGLTQFGRAMRELDIELIFANSPQAKGRVERVNKTLQDRLPKEMRLAGINSWEEGNKFLLEYTKKFNKKFSVPPAIPESAHTPLTPEEKLEEILVQKFTRLLSKTLTVSFQNKLYQILLNPGLSARVLQGQRVRVLLRNEGSVKIIYKSEQLNYKVLTIHHTAHIVDSKLLNDKVDSVVQEQSTRAKIHIPAANHPWRSFSTNNYQKPLLITP